jgi:hypothetical protein
MSGDCNKIGCENPCNVRPPANTAACESLPSQIENFTLEFFGETFKTEVDGKVEWSLPCRLDVGLPLNRRGPSEPLACYFLRMFGFGVVGARGEQGSPGRTGANGNTPYVQIQSGFNRPTLDVPFAVRVSHNPTFLPGMDVFIEGTGWFEVSASDGFGNATLVLRKEVVNPQPWVAAGTYILPSGKIGGEGATGVQGIKGMPGDKGIKGDTGIQGPQGDTGASTQLPTIMFGVPLWVANPANSALIYYSGYMGGVSNNVFVPVVLLPGSVAAKVTLPNPGSYLLLAWVGNGVVPTPESPGHTVGDPTQGNNQFQLKNVSTNTVLPQTTIQTWRATLGNQVNSGVEGNQPGARIVGICQTVTPNNVIQVFAKSVSGTATVSVALFWAIKIA